MAILRQTATHHEGDMKSLYNFTSYFSLFMVLTEPFSSILYLKVSLNTESCFNMHINVYLKGRIDVAIRQRHSIEHKTMAGENTHIHTLHITYMECISCLTCDDPESNSLAFIPWEWKMDHFPVANYHGCYHSKE